jgi:hypothetical protein
VAGGRWSFRRSNLIVDYTAKEQQDGNVRRLFQIFLPIPATITKTRYLPEREAELDFFTLTLLTTNSCAGRKSLSNKKAVPHRTERRF